MQGEHMGMTQSVTEHNQRVLSSLHNGYIIRIPREIYDHFAVYIGDGYVVHFGKDEKGKCYVKMDDFFEVCMNSKAEVCNYLDNKIRPLDSKEIVARAKSMIGKTGYDLLTQNCEHLATFCRYGIKHSQQVLTGFGYFTSIACIILTIIFIIAIIIVLRPHGMRIKEDSFIDGQDLFHLLSPDRLFMSTY